QVRDANGRFAKLGDTGVVQSSGLRGKISNVSPGDNTLMVETEDGQSYLVQGSDFKVDSAGKPADGGKPDPNKITKPPDFSGILGQPRAVGNTPKAMLPYLLQPMGPGQL